MIAPSVEERNVDPATLSQLRQEVVELYVDKIPRKMKNAGFSMKQMHSCFHKLIDGVDRYTSWRKAKEENSDELGNFGFTSRQLSCLHEIEEDIKELDFKHKATAPVKYESLRLMASALLRDCLLVMTGAVNGRDADKERNQQANYRNRYWWIAHAVGTEKESTVLRPTFMETLTQLNGGCQQTVNEMIALLSADFSTPQSGPKDATSHTSIWFRHGSDMSIGNFENEELRRLGNTRECKEISSLPRPHGVEVVS